MSAAVKHPAERWRVDASSKTLVRDLAEEVPVAIGLNGGDHIVLMATPGDLEDLAAGFVVTERIAAFDRILETRIERVAAGFTVEVRLEGRPAIRERRLTSRSSCGLCGVTALRDAVRPVPLVESDLCVTRSAIHRALGELEDRQALGQLTRATHAAALADSSGAVVLVREDVGRHNALDKLVGAALRAGLPAREHMVLVTSRCSFEMVDKTAVFGSPILISVSAPTALAVDLAKEAGLTLAALARADGHTVFSHSQRILP